MVRNKAGALVFFLLACYTVAFVAVFMTRPEITTWYASLAKPAWQPPNWLFGPVWTLLYGMIAVAGWRVWCAPQSKWRAFGLWVFGAQLGVNFLWSPVFFNLHRIGFAFVIIFTLWLLLAFFVGVTWRFERVAAFLFLPYLLWVTLAAALNYTVWKMNPPVSRSISGLPTAFASRFSNQPDAEGFPDSRAWAKCSPLCFAHNWKGENADPARSTEVRLLWTPDTLFVRFLANYRNITVFPDAREDGWRDELWNRDVAEVFLQPDSREPRRYKEFEVSPNGQWIDLDIASGGKEELRSKLRRRVMQDALAKTWTAELVIPMRSLTPNFDAKQSWRVNFFRVEGEGEARFYSAWSPTYSHEANFHVSGAFGMLVFRE
jgi:benzodiazapine receptor